MKKLVGHILILPFVFSCLVFINCKKKETDSPPTPSTGTYQGPSIISRHHLYEYILNDIVNIASLVSETGSLGIYNSASSCATVSIANNTIIVDYGFTDCLCKDGKLRRGKLIYDFSGSTNNATSFKMPGFNLNVTSDYYNVHGFSITINKKRITNTSPLSIIGETSYSGIDLQWTDSTSVIIGGSGLEKTDTLIFARSIKLLNSNDTICYKGQLKPLKWYMARIQMDGSSSGRMEDLYLLSRPSTYFQSNVVNLTRDFNCSPEGMVNNYNPFISGFLHMTANSKQGTINYGNGTCDPDYVFQ